MSKYYLIEYYINNEGECIFEYTKTTIVNTSFLLIADPHSNFFIHRSIFDENSLPKGVEKIPSEIETLLLSSEGYAPAITLAQNEIDVLCREKPVYSKDKFFNLYKKVLKKYLERQPYDGFFLAEFIQEEFEKSNHTYSYDFSNGEFVWIVGYLEEKDLLKCISSIYEICYYPSKYFKFDKNLLSKINKNN